MLSMRYEGSEDMPKRRVSGSSDTKPDTVDKLNKTPNKNSTSRPRAHLAAIILGCVTFFSIVQFDPYGSSLWNVWNYGLVTCISTGLGAIPFFYIEEIKTWWLGVCNAIAAGMMICASLTLVMEGCNLDPDATASMSQIGRTLLGIVAGFVFIVLTKHFLDEHEELKLDVDGLFTKRVLLIMTVMTFHSFAEGVGIGVAFGEGAGPQLGYFVSATLAVHNVPEGLAVCLVLIPRGQSILHAALWAVFSSAPQPIMAVVAYLFVNEFSFLLPFGLGFAGGAMAWVACFELLVEAIDLSSARDTAVAACASFVVMSVLSVCLKGGV